MGRRRAIAHTAVLAMLCIATESIIVNVWLYALDFFEAIGLLASANEAYQQQYVYITMAMRIGPVILLALLFWMLNMSPIKELYMHPIDVSTGAYAAVIGLSACFSISLLLAVIPFPETWTTAYNEQASQVMVNETPFLTAVSTVALAPIAEEVLYRGILYGRLKEGIPRVAAALVSAGLFAIAHGTVIWVFYAFLLGLLFAFMYECTGSILPGIIAHIVFNIFGQLSLFPPGTPPIVIWIVHTMSFPLLGAALILLFGKKATPKVQSLETVDLPTEIS